MPPIFPPRRAFRSATRPASTPRPACRNWDWKCAASPCAIPVRSPRGQALPRSRPGPDGNAGSMLGPPLPARVYLAGQLIELVHIQRMAAVFDKDPGDETPVDTRIDPHRPPQVVEPQHFADEVVGTHEMA